MKKTVYYSIVFCLFFLFLHLWDVDAYIYNEAHALLHSRDNKGLEIQLNDYVLESFNKVACQDKNLSGITFNHITQTLFAVTNRPAALYEIDKTGKCLRMIKLHNFHDTEGVVFIEDNKFAIIEEGSHRLSIIKIEMATTSVGPSDIVNSIAINLKGSDNKGFEGISYDPKNQSFYIVNEKKPMQLIRIDGIYGDTRTIKISLEPDLIPKKLYMNDFSGLHFDLEARRLLFLSDESKLVSEVSLQGKIMSFMKLKKSFAHLTNDIPQPEGITMDDEGNIYIVSEPNLFYKFVKTQG